MLTMEGLGFKALGLRVEGVGAVTIRIMKTEMDEYLKMKWTMTWKLQAYVVFEDLVLGLYVGT